MFGDPSRQMSVVFETALNSEILHSEKLSGLKISIE